MCDDDDALVDGDDDFVSDEEVVVESKKEKSGNNKDKHEARRKLELMRERKELREQLGDDDWSDEFLSEYL